MIEVPILPQAIRRDEVCALSTVRRVAAMLDLEPDTIRTGDALPRGWQFTLLAADTRRSALRADGFPGLGVPMPDLGLPRLMLVGRSVTFLADITVGAELVRHSRVEAIKHKSSASGPMVSVTIAHELHMSPEAQPALTETQTYLLMPAREAGSPLPDSTIGPPVTAAHCKTVVPDETLLFQYCALGFNSHRIHLDRDHARSVEGFPDLVVNGGLATLFMTEFLRLDLGLVPSALRVRHMAPLYCGRPITLGADRVGDSWTLKAYDERNTLAVQMEVEVR
jgi:3-methylfumaryl-CoA hydratase